MPSLERYVFSGHESFPCKSLWLKRGYDFVFGGNDFNSADAVVKLGVGKNMVASIRYWMKAFGLTESDRLNDLAGFIFSSEYGKDPFVEDLGTLWLLHFMLVSSKEASLYNLFYSSFQRERQSFERQQVVSFVRRCMIEDGKVKVFNENTVKKDVGVLLQNYVQPLKPQSMEDYSALLLDLDLIRTLDGKQFYFNMEGKRQLPEDILLYAIVKESNGERNVDYDMLQSIGLIFCLSDIELIHMLQTLQERYPSCLRYSDTAGVRQLQLLKAIEPMNVLRHYYDNEEI